MSSEHLLWLRRAIAAGSVYLLIIATAGMAVGL